MSILGKPTDQDLDQYPHVLLTSPHEWNPLYWIIHVPIPVDTSNLLLQLGTNMIPGYMNVVTSTVEPSILYSFFLIHPPLLYRTMISNPQP